MLASPQTALFTLDLRISDSNDAARVYVEGVLVAEAIGGTLVGSGQVYLLRGALHAITIEYHESIGTAAIALAWSSREVSHQPIASYYLYPSWMPIDGSPFALELSSRNKSA